VRALALRAREAARALRTLPGARKGAPESRLAVACCLIL